MTKQEFSAYLWRASIRKAQHPEWRMGQTYFNVLRELHPEIAEVFRGEYHDPFHNDRWIPDFLSDVYDLYVTK